MQRMLTLLLAAWLLVQAPGLPGGVGCTPDAAPHRSDPLQSNQGCSVLYATDGEAFLGGNNEAYVNPLTKVWFVPGEGGAFGRVYVGFDDHHAQGGMNDQGLFFDGLALDEPLPIATEGKERYTGNLVDKAMAECGTVECVVGLFQRFHTRDSWSWQFLFGDATGESAIVEPGTILRQQGSYQVATNFPQSITPPEERTCWRYQKAVELLENVPALSVEAVRDVLNAVHVDGPSQTLYSTIYDLKSKRVHVYHFHNYDDVVVLDLEAELAQGYHAYDLPALFPPNAEAEAWAQPILRSYNALIASRSAADVDPASLGAYAGAYEMPAGWGPPGQSLSVIAQEQSLLLRFPDYRQHELFPASATDFFHVAFQGGDVVVAYEARFGRDEDQGVEVLELLLGDEPVRLARIGPASLVPGDAVTEPTAVPEPTPTADPTDTPVPAATAGQAAAGAPAAAVTEVASVAPWPAEGDAFPRAWLIALLVLAAVATGWLLVRRLANRRSEQAQVGGAAFGRLPPALTEVQALLDRGDVEAAQRVLRDFLKAHPEHAQAWYLWSLVDPLPRGQVVALRQALRLDPGFEDARLRLRALESPSEIQGPPPSCPAEPDQQAPLVAVAQESPKRRGIVSSMGGYVLRRTLVILLTIVAGVYVTVLITNKTGQIDANIRSQIEDQLGWMRSHDQFTGESELEVDAEMVRKRVELQAAAGLDLPLALRNIRWTANALIFRWGKVVIWMIAGNMQVPTQGLYEVQDVILRHFPNTLLIIGTANLITFVVGLPLALFLASRKQGQWLDRLVTMLSPLSSIPSWVHGIVLVAIFAVQLQLLPYGGKYDILPAETWHGDAAVVAKHMVLPVAAVLLGMFFQLVYAWRTFFVIYAEEDYVDLAQAKGLHPIDVERRYILRPALPFAITSFALTLVGFWQMTTALEFFFNWPGIGQLYIHHLPQYFEEYFFEGELSIILSLVVIFAYLLGLTVLLLDVIYAWVDPRVRLGTSGYTMKRLTRRARRWWPFKPKTDDGSWEGPALARRAKAPRFRPRLAWADWRISLRNLLTGLKNAFREVLRYPSAVVGLLLVAVFVIGSLYAVIALPYMQVGEQWRSASLTGKVYVPKNVPAVWTNWFRRHDSPSTLVYKSLDGTIEKTVQTLESGLTEISFTLDLDYEHTGFAQALLLYIKSRYQEKRPHLTLTWTTPDGRQIDLKSPFIRSEDTYFFSDNVRARALVRKNEPWQEWFVVEGQNATPAFYALFADPMANEPKALPGLYQLDVSALTFEPGTDVDIEFVLLGKVYGLAGTDYLRRDLLVPLLWGLPFALAFGLVGATLTTVLAMIVSAAGVWFGGWVDGLVQRLTEVNMILPILAIGVLLYALYGLSLWMVLAIVIALNVFSSPTKAFRAAFLQIREAPYIESARAYGATNARVVFRYMIPRIVPTLIPQLVTLIPAMVWLEATLGILRVYDPRFPTWGRVIFEALDQQALWGGSLYWVFEPISLLLLIGLAFALLGFALERILNPRLQTK